VWRRADADHYPWLSGPYARLRTDRHWDDLDMILRRFDVSAGIVVQVEHSSAETARLLSAAAQRSGTYVVGWVDLRSADIAIELERLRALPGGQRLVGVRHLVQDEPDPRWLLRDDVRRGIEACGRAGVVVDLVVRAPQWPAVETVVTDLPAVSFVLDHAGKPPLTGAMEEWRSFIQRLAHRENVACKLSGLVTEADLDGWRVDLLRPAVRHLASCFGADRLMFGSDWPMCEVAGGYEAWLAAALLLIQDCDLDPDQVLAATARRRYRLPTSGQGRSPLPEDPP